MGSLMSCSSCSDRDRLAPSSHKEVETVFKKYDKDGNGKLDKGEFKAFFADLFPDEEPTSKVDALMDMVDLNHDGTVGMNELRAFLRFYDIGTKMLKKKTALIIIDVQNDFITGSLANQYNAVEIVPVINAMRDKFDVVVISMDWHPYEHCSFVESCNAGKIPIVEPQQEFAAFSSVTLKGDASRPEHKQTLYPRHAVQKSEGGACHPDLVVKSSDDKIYKGTLFNIDSYSAFYDNCKANDTGLAAVLEEHGVTDVYCCGLVLDICVKSTALHGAELGFKVAVIEDACRPLMQDNVPKTKKELSEAGVEVLSSADAEQNVESLRANTFCTLQQYLAEIQKGRSAKSIHKELEKATSSHALS